MFAKKYDLLPGRLGKEIMIEYMERRMILWKGARLGFRKGHSPAEVRCMEVLRDLITGKCLATDDVTSFKFRAYAACRIVQWCPYLWKYQTNI